LAAFDAIRALLEFFPLYFTARHTAIINEHIADDEPVCRLSSRLARAIQRETRWNCPELASRALYGGYLGLGIAQHLAGLNS